MLSVFLFHQKCSAFFASEAKNESPPCTPAVSLTLNHAKVNNSPNDVAIAAAVDPDLRPTSACPPDSHSVNTNNVAERKLLQPEISQEEVVAYFRRGACVTIG